MSWWNYYTVERASKGKDGKVSWKCERATTTKKNFKCLGRVLTIGECEPVNDITEHNHIPDPIREEVLSVVNENKRLALETNDNGTCQFDDRSVVKFHDGKIHDRRQSYFFYSRS